MKVIIKELKKQHKNLTELIQKRYDKVDNMSKNWFETEKFREWQYKTIDIATQAKGLNIVIEELINLSKKP